MAESSIAIARVESDGDRSALRTLLVEYHEWMAGHEPSYDPDAELREDLESLADEPESWAWLARVDGTPAGCVLLYGASDTFAEFKRLWVGPEYRGDGIGRGLTRTVIRAARDRGYETLGLTTPPWSETAQLLYETLGFERTPPYPETRLPEQYHDDATFMQLDLSRAGEPTADG